MANAPNMTLCDEIVNAAGTGKNAPVMDTLGAIAAITSTTQYIQSIDIVDASAEAVYYFVAPFAGTIAKIYTVIDSAVLTADVTITGKIGAAAITNGVVTITQSGSAAGDIDEATPTAANVVTAGQAVNFTVTGGGSAATGPRIHLVAVITRS
jgi:hypothetical protein